MGYAWLLVAAGGALGAVLRYGAGLAAAQWFDASWPISTAFVNVVGSFVLGFVAGLGPLVSPEVRTFVGTGLLGAFTTFSTYSVETVVLANSGDAIGAIGNVAFNTIIGVLGASLGLALARFVSQA
ncbi:MAG: fluoride efflux transporter CrcB [Myxococcota bacterium]